jgi:hypothetical protein
MFFLSVNETKTTVPPTYNKTPLYGVQIMAFELEGACECCSPTLSLVKTFSLTFPN